MSVVSKQARFTVCIADLIIWADSRGYQLTFGEAYRPRELAELYAAQGRGIANSNHTRRLAVDFNVFKDGVYLTDGADFADLGAYWESLDPNCRWGGRFRDGNHFSFEHNGVK